MAPLRGGFASLARVSHCSMAPLRKGLTPGSCESGFSHSTMPRSEAQPEMRAGTRRSEAESREPSGTRFPDALVLICGLILLAQLATYVLPAGEFERDGRQVLGGTYHVVDAEPLPLFTFQSG